MTGSGDTIRRLFDMDDLPEPDPEWMWVDITPAGEPPRSRWVRARRSLYEIP